MHSTKVLALLIGAALVTPALSALADPKPIPVQPPPDSKDKGKKKPMQFPMPSSDFRPILDDIISKLQAAAAQARNNGEKVPEGFAEKMRFRGSQAMEDGVVTMSEFEYVMDAAD
jgi:hypothetical protein